MSLTKATILSIPWGDLKTLVLTPIFGDLYVNDWCKQICLKLPWAISRCAINLLAQNYIFQSSYSISLVQLNAETKTLAFGKNRGKMIWKYRTLIINTNVYELHIATQIKAHFCARMYPFSGVSKRYVYQLAKLLRSRPMFVFVKTLNKTN